MGRNAGAARGARVSLLGMLSNLVLAAAKITLGSMFSLVSIVADGINNVSDCGSGLISLVSFRISEKPADSEHPYGHRRAEHIATLTMGILVLFLAFELVRGSIEKLIGGSVSEVSWAVFLVLGVSIAVKAAMYVCYRREAKKLSSEVLRASAIDSLCDCGATASALIGLLIEQYTSFPADGVAGILVALFIAWQGISILKAAVSQLLGKAPEPALVEAIKGEISAEKRVLGMHDLHVFSYGQNALYATVHIEMDATMSAIEAHAIIDGIEHAVREKLGVSLTAHLDPVDLFDTEALALKEEILSAAEGISKDLELHDFRLVRGKQTKVIFDADVPFSLEKTDGEICAALEEIVEKCGDFLPVVTVERR